MSVGDDPSDARSTSEQVQFNEAPDVERVDTQTVVQVKQRIPDTIESLTFNDAIDGTHMVGACVWASGMYDRDFTFKADDGNAVLTVEQDLQEEVTVGREMGTVVLASDLDIVHNGSGNLTFASGIAGESKNITLSGTGTNVFCGINSYSGNTLIEADSTLVLADDAQLTFVVGDNGVNNGLSGQGTAWLHGTLLIDLSGAERSEGNSWQLLDLNRLKGGYGESLKITSTSGSFVELNNLWRIKENGVIYEFSQRSGQLRVVPALPVVAPVKQTLPKRKTMSNSHPASWMSGSWGVGWRFNAANKKEIANWEVEPLVEQVKSIPGVKYVLFNLSDGAYGDTYIAPHSVLTAITPSATPLNDRDLFLEMATAFQAAGIKVIAYIACQGPAMLKHGASAAFDKKKVDGAWTSQAMDNWKNYVYSVYKIRDFEDEREMYKTAFAEIIVDEYAKRYGTLIDGWWFDNGSRTMNPELLHEVVTKYNPNTVLAFNGSGKYLDYQNGHPTVLGKALPSDDANLPKLERIEDAKNGYMDGEDGEKVLGHMFMPMHDRWNGGKICWEVSKAADWQSRCMKAGGAWTWNVDVTASQSMLREDTVSLMKKIVKKMETLK